MVNTRSESWQHYNAQAMVCQHFGVLCTCVVYRISVHVFVLISWRVSRQHLIPLGLLMILQRNGMRLWHNWALTQLMLVAWPCATEHAEGDCLGVTHAMGHTLLTFLQGM